MSKDLLYAVPSKSEPLPIMFHTLSPRYQQDSEYRMNGFKNLYQILLVLDGEGELFCNGKSYKLKRGCAFFTSPPLPHKYLNYHDLVTAFITYPEGFMGDILDYYENDGFVFTSNINVNEYVACIKAMKEEYFSRKREPLLSAMTYSFVINFFEDVYSTNLSDIERVSLYIERNYAKSLTLNEIAQVYNTSVSKLCRDFKSNFGCTVFEYILDLRLSHAHSFLQSNQKALIKNVARNSGFTDECYFCRAYKKKYGHSPSQR